MPHFEAQPAPLSETCPQAPLRGRLTFGDMYLELPIDEAHPANRKLLGVLGREIRDCRTGKPVLTFQQLADQLGYGDRRDVQNFHRDLRGSEYDALACLTRKATKHDRLSPLIEAAILEAPLLSPHQQYLSFCEAHPAESLSEDTFRRYANEIEGLKIVRRVRQLLSPETHCVETNRYLSEVLAYDRLSEAKHKEIVEVFAEVETSAPM